MSDQEFLEAALGLEAPWRLDRVDFDPDAERVDLYLAFEQGARFPCPVCERASCPVRDTKERTWQHLNLFQHHSFVHARVPRVVCPDHGVHQVHIPWARDGSGFTLLLFEALVMGLLPQMPDQQRPDGGHPLASASGKRKARGYQTKANLIAMTYLMAGKLQLVTAYTK